jgi:hypothetical protein
MELNTPFIESAERSSRRESEPPKEPTPCSGPIFDDVPWWRPPGAPKHHIYQQYFTPAERLRLEAIPENDVTSEIRLLRVLLARSFAQIPQSSHDKKRAPLPLKLHTDLLSTFSRVSIVIGGLVGLHRKIHKNDVGDIILEALRELNPHEEL